MDAEVTRREQGASPAVAWSPRILVVEDDADTARLVQEVLEDEGLRVTVVNDGPAAVEAVASQPVDVLLLDVMLPNMSGWEVCQALRSLLAFRMVPVIMMSALGTVPDRVRGLDVGADDYLPKPFSLAELSARVRAALRRRQVNLELRELTEVDHLTGLHNQRFFQEYLPKALQLASRQARPLALLMLDLDHFKAINDTYGHERGNDVLRAVGAAIHSQLRESDVACRYAGDEFALILHDTGRDGALQAAARVHQAIGAIRLRGSNDQPISITPSIGVASFPADAANSRALIEAADGALYAAKRGGRNTMR